MHLLKYLRRVAMGVVLALTLMVGTMGSGRPRTTTQARPKPNTTPNTKSRDQICPLRLRSSGS
jgi:hypothetical protein